MQSKHYVSLFLIQLVLLHENTLAQTAHYPDGHLQRVFQESLERLTLSVETIQDSSRYPSYGTENLDWQLRNSEDWTSGFFPGCLWLAYAGSEDIRFRDWAVRWSDGIRNQIDNRETHDLGFRFMCTYGNQFKYDPEADKEAIKRLLLHAANTLSHRFNPKVGALSSNWDRWEDPRGETAFPVVIDIMMNLELLFWAAENAGDPELRKIAETHACTTWNDFVRPDGGTFHVVRYDPNTGERWHQGQLQGDTVESTWSRGQAWAIYGYVVCYRFTHNIRYLQWAKTLLDYFISQLPPDHIAPWDFDSPIKAKDVSASAIVASALFEFADHCSDLSAKTFYLGQAQDMLETLASSPWFIPSCKQTPCLLDASTQYLPLGQNVERPAIFADYYFMEALLRASKHQKASIPPN